MLARENFEGPRCGTTGNNPKGWQSETGWAGGERLKDRSSRYSEHPSSEFRITPFAHVSRLTRYGLWNWRTVSASGNTMLADHQREVVDSRAFQGV